MTGRWRPELQGLRALAVVAVLVFHTWPAALPGGYVGVDAFFVLSGYLMTGLLREELSRTGGVALGAFYARRVRRLLPTATLVLVAVAAGAPLLPDTRWADTGAELVASALYVQNLWLAHRAVDYLADERGASPLLHLWSLAIEEQFYVVWPALLLLASRLRAVAFAVAAVLALSFVDGLLSDGSATAYLRTDTRLWELALGGALTFAPPVAGVPAVVLGGLGLAALAGSALSAAPEGSWPGWRALVPTLGTAGVLLGGPHGVGRGLALPAAGWLGHRSYPFYLWHWPLAVIWEVRGGAPGPMALAAVGLSALGLAQLTHHAVEEPLRRPGPRLGWLLLPSALPIAAGLGLQWVGRIDLDTPRDPERFPGGAVLFSDAVAPPGEDPWPPYPGLRGQPNLGCLLDERYTVPAPCDFGDPAGPRVVLVGDSHAKHWLPALVPIAEARGWSLRAQVKAACVLSPDLLRRTNGPYVECQVWGEQIRRELEADPPALVILAGAGWHRLDGVKRPTRDRAMIQMYRRLWADLRALGSQVVVMPDTPTWESDPVECVESGKTCLLPADAPVAFPDLVPRAAQAQDVGVLDLRDLVCPDDCPAVIGNVLVWYDVSHVRGDYVETLIPEVERRLDAILDPPLPVRTPPPR